MNISILRYDTIGSTNTEAARQARLGVNEGLCVIAGEQTSGRGRYGRTWVSEKDAGLYLSIVLRPRIEPRFLPLITLMTGVAVHDVLREFDVICDIKWVNDLLTGDKKISGILAETVDTPAGLAVVAGIGINLTSQNFSEDLARIATSVEQETGKRIPPDELAEGLTPLLSHFYAILNSASGPRKIIDHWHQRSSYYIGKLVRVTLQGSVFDGITDGLEENGALRVRTGNGRVRVIQAGDVERLRPK